MKTVFWGILSILFHYILPVKKKLWIFGADCGNMYREGSKYLIEHILQNHKDIDCYFITKDKSVFNELKVKGIPCLMNNSFRGLIKIARCDSVFFTQNRSDINFAYKKKHRCHYYLVHGMPYKKALLQMPSEIKKEIQDKKNKNKIDLRASFCRWLGISFDLSDITFVSATSDFLADFQRREFHPNVEIKTLGMPRNDALFQPERMEKEKWIEGVDNKFIITYMPTHRLYGMGEVTPTPFANQPTIQEWFRENNVVLLVKNHPNMIPHIKNELNEDWCKDITKNKLDPQVCIYHSDVLITDYSSVWMDYLLLKRPMIFYYYDDFEKNDVGAYYDLRDDPPGHFCYDEEELFELIKQCKNNYSQMGPSERIIKKYHKYIDGNSCERHYQEIVKRYKE